MTLAFPEIEEEMYSPTHYKPIAPSGIVATAAIAFAFMAGTGGVTTAEYLQQRGYRDQVPDFFRDDVHREYVQLVNAAGLFD
jgi:hypothetical protein